MILLPYDNCNQKKKEKKRKHTLQEAELKNKEERNK